MTRRLDADDRPARRRRSRSSTARACACITAPRRCWAACRWPARAVPNRARRAARFVRLRLESPAVLTRGDRFILRAYSPPMTIGGGIVLDPAPTRAGRAVRRDGLGSALEQVRSGGDDEPRRVAAMIDARAGWPACRASAVVTRGGVAAGGRRGAARGAGGASGSSQRWRSPGCAASPRAGARMPCSAAGGRVAQGQRRSAKALPREEARERLFARVAPAHLRARCSTDLKAAQALVGTRAPGAADAQGGAWPAPTIAVATAIAEAYRGRRTQAAGCRRIWPRR